MTVFLDIIWLLNFLFDSLLLFLTNFILKRHALKRNIFAAGFLGSLIIFAPLFPVTSFLLTPVGKIIVSVLMIFIAFGYRNFRYFIMNWLTFYLCTFVAGGGLFGIHYLLLSHDGAGYAFVTKTISGFGDPISWLFVMIVFPLVLFISRGTYDHLVDVKIQYDQIIDVVIVIDGMTIPLKGLIDSGNHLYDPLTKKPVMIASLEKIEGMIPGELVRVFENVHELASLNDTLLHKWNIAVIPYRVVGQESKILAAMQPDKVEFQYAKRVLEAKHVLVAFVRHNFSRDHHFDCIIHPKMLHEATVTHVS